MPHRRQREHIFREQVDHERKQQKFRRDDEQRKLQIAEHTVLAERHAHREQRTGHGRKRDHIDEGLWHSAKLYARDTPDRSRRERDQKRVGDEIPDELEDCFARDPGIRAFDHHGCRKHHEREMHRDQEKERHRAGFAVSREHQGNAQQDDVRLRRRKAHDDGFAAGPAVNLPRHELRERPHDRDADEIGEPVTPRAAFRQRGAEQCLHDHDRNRDDENEVVQALARLFGKQLRPHRDIAERNHAEDRQYDFCDACDLGQVYWERTSRPPSNR